MPDLYTPQNYGAFSGPSAIYEYTDVEGTWHTQIPQDVSLNGPNLGVILYGNLVVNPVDYVGFYCPGVSTKTLFLAGGTGILPSFIKNVSNTINNGVTINNGAFTNNGAVIVNGAETVNGTLNVTGAITGPSPTIWNAKKGFDIPHPSKENHRLRYICVEGPSAEVYLRGKLKEETVIELPEYWRNLVDIETIGVTLTPIGHYQELFVEKIEWGTHIHIKNNSGTAINCHYIVYGERKDSEKNIPEYVGLTPKDYPGDNREYNINGL
jgi:hypothetical protein